MQVERKELSSLKYGVLDRKLRGLDPLQRPSINEQLCQDILDWYPLMYKCIPTLYSELVDIWKVDVHKSLRLSGTYQSDIPVDFCQHRLPQGVLGLSTKPGNWIVVGKDSVAQENYRIANALNDSNFCLERGYVELARQQETRVASLLPQHFTSKAPRYDSPPPFLANPKDNPHDNSFYKTTIFETSAVRPNGCLLTTIDVLNNIFLYKHNAIVDWLSTGIRAIGKTKNMLLSSYKQMAVLIKEAYDLVERIKSTELPRPVLDFLGLPVTEEIVDQDVTISLDKYPEIRSTFSSVTLICKAYIHAELVTHNGKRIITLYNKFESTAQERDSLQTYAPQVLSAAKLELTSIYLSLLPLIQPVKAFTQTIEQRREMFDTLRAL